MTHSMFRHRLFGRDVRQKTPRIRLARARQAMPVFVLLLCLLASGCTSLLPSPSPSADSAQTSARPADPATDPAVMAWVQSLSGLTPMEQARQAEQAWHDQSRPAALRERAMYLLATRPSSQTAAAQQELSFQWAQSDVTRRAAMERLLLADLATADNDTLRLLGTVPPSREKLFPWTLTVHQAASRGLLADSAGALNRLSDPALYAAPSLLGLAAGAPALPQAKSGQVALVLPLSGPFGRVGGQVAAGARAAAAALATEGVDMVVTIIDSEQPDWLTRIAALPADCVTVGGPLQPEKYTAMRQTGLPGRVQFAFLSHLPDAAEGSSAWRFFTGTGDQLDAVLQFAAGDLGITSFGVLAPNDPYGARMTDLFLERASGRGLSVATATYPPDDMKAWTRTAGDFVQAAATARGKIPRARASFEAVFLPDSWKNMDMLISALQYHGAGHMIMLGTQLWEQGLASARGLNASTFGLTVFPGVWNAQDTGAAATAFRQHLGSGQANDWSVLGFDFVRFASALGLSAPENAAALNRRLSAGVSMDWAGAPVTWSPSGQARRELILFQPSREGMVVLDRAAFNLYRAGKGPLPNVPAAVPAEDEVTADQEADISALVDAIVGGASTPAEPAGR